MVTTTTMKPCYHHGNPQKKAEKFAISKRVNFSAAGQQAHIKRPRGSFWERILSFKVSGSKGLVILGSVIEDI